MDETQTDNGDVGARYIAAAVSGEYSDYTVNFVFARKEDAAAWIAKANVGRSEYSRFEVEEFAFVPVGQQPRLRTEFVAFWYPRDPDTWPPRVYRKESGWTMDPPTKRPTVEWHHHVGNCLEMRGEDEAHVRKAFHDQIAKYRANTAGVT